MVIADGLYATEQMISTSIKEKFYFEKGFTLNVLLNIITKKLVSNR